MKAFKEGRLQADFNKGIIRVTFIDANDNTLVLDIKPYTPSFDRVEMPGVPVWCRKWSRSTEESGCFHWGIVYKKDHKVIGKMWVYPIENGRMAKVAFRLSPIYQGNGLMTEALTEVVIFCFEKQNYNVYGLMFTF